MRYDQLIVKGDWVRKTKSYEYTIDEHPPVYNGKGDKDFTIVPENVFRALSIWYKCDKTIEIKV